MNNTPTRVSAADAITLDQTEAERLTKLSAKTLERAALAGEPVGRIKVGRRVLFVRTALEQWIASKLLPSNNASHPETTAR